MKLFHIDFEEMTRAEYVSEDDKVGPMTFENSELYSYFADHELLCIIFREPQISIKGEQLPFDENIFVGFKRLVFRDDFIDTCVKRLWDDTRTKIAAGTLIDVPVTQKDGTIRYNKNGEPMSAPNFLKSKENAVFIRGGATDSSAKHKTEMVNGIRMLPQYVWIKGAAVLDELSNLP